MSDLKRKYKSPPAFKRTKYDFDVEDESSEEIAKQFKKFSSSPKYNLNLEEVFCICRRPDHGGELMVCCDGCEEWFHFRCMKVDQIYSKLIFKFFCKFCKWKGIGTTQWKRMCRLPSCYEPVDIENKSKYCCNEHGIQFLKEQILNHDSTVGDITSEQIKSVLKHADGNHEKLVLLGTEFPELPEVQQLQHSNDYSKFPESIRHQLSERDSKIESIKAQIAKCQFRSEFLLKFKNKIKVVNEKLVLAEEPSKKSKSKSRKHELCLYDKSLFYDPSKLEKEQWEPLLKSEDIYVDFKDEIDGIIAAYKLAEEEDGLYMDKICLKDRRKCVKHNGWWNLANDELYRATSELTSSLELLEQEKKDILRQYTVDIYERGKTISKGEIEGKGSNEPS